METMLLNVCHSELLIHVIMTSKPPATQKRTQNNTMHRGFVYFIVF